MKKRLSGLYKTAAAVAVLGTGLLLLASCDTIFGSSREEAGGSRTGTVEITFGNGVEGARTLLPSGESFRRYELTITPESGSPPQTVAAYSASPPPIELDVGAWSIHVDAYTEGNNKAAEGDSGSFEVTAGQTKPVNITLRAVTGAGKGTLSVDISGGSSIIGGGRLYIYGGTDFNDPVEFSDGASNVFSVPIASGGLDLDISLPAGQYRVRAEIANSDNQWAYINEVAYIYSNLTTGLVEVLGAGDFIDVTTISGTALYRENGEDQSGYTLELYTANPREIGYNLGGTYIENTGPYTIRVPRPDKNVTLHFYVYKNGWVYADSLNLAGGQEMAEKDIILDPTLSGSVSFTLGGVPLTVTSVSAYPYNATVTNDSWTMPIHSYFSGTLRFTVEAQDSNEQSYSVSNGGSWTSGSPATGISLTASLIKVSGSFTAKENENPINSGYVSVSAYRETTPGSGVFDVYLGGQSGYNWTGNTYNWTFTTTALSPAAQAQIRISSIGGSHTATENITLGTSNVTVPSRAYAFSAVPPITLSGSASVTLGGTPLTVTSVRASSYSATVNDNSWTMTIPANFSGTSFNIEGRDDEGRSYSVSNVGFWTAGSPTTGISLTASLVKVSGSFTATENGNPINSGYISVSAYREMTPGSGVFDVYLGGQSGYNWTGDVCNWTFTTAAFSPEIQAQIRITSIGGFQTVTETVTLGTSNKTVPPGAYVFPTLSGKVTLGGAPLTDGAPLTVTSLSASSEGGGSYYYTTGEYNEYNGSWTMTIPANFSGTLRFTINAQDSGGKYHSIWDVGSWTAGSPTTDINLPLIMVSGSFTARENGNPINSGNVNFSAYREETSGSGDATSVASLAVWHNYKWTGNTCNWAFFTKPLSPAAQAQIRISLNNIDGYQNTATESILLGASNETIPSGEYTFTTLSGTIGAVTLNGQPPDGVSVYARTANEETYQTSVSGTTWRISGIPDFTGPLAIEVVALYANFWYTKDVAVWNSGSTPTGINLGDVSFILRSISGTVTDGESPMAQGLLYVGSPTTDPSDYLNQTPLGGAEITGGSFSGYYDDDSGSVTSGYVGIIEDLLVPGALGYIYVTPSPVTLDTSMSLNLSTMTRYELPVLVAY